MPAFPLFVNLEGKKCLVFGGGNVALRKIRTLLKFGMDIYVSSLEYSKELDELIENKRIKEIHIENIYENQEIFKDFYMVIAATNDVDFNHELSVLCQQFERHFNSVTSAEDSTFLFPSTVIRGNVVTGVSSSGHAPALTKHIRKQLEEVLPEWYDALEKRMEVLRKLGEEKLDTQKQRQDFMRQMLAIGLKNEAVISDDVAELILKQIKGQVSL